MLKKPKKKVSNMVLVLICTMIISYTAANFVLQYFTSVEVSPTLTTAWFAFWGGEAGLLALIKISKVIKGETDITLDEQEPETDVADERDCE